MKVYLAGDVGDGVVAVLSDLHAVYGSLTFSCSDVLPWFRVSGASFRLFAPYAVPVSFGGPSSELTRVEVAVSVASAGLSVCVLPAWEPGLACVGTYFSFSPADADRRVVALGSSHVSFTSGLAPVACAVYFCDPAGGETDSFVCSLFSNVRSCLYVVDPRPFSVLGGVLDSLWEGACRAPHFDV